VNTPVDLAPRPSSPLHTVPADGELDLAAFLELFVPDDAARTPSRPSLRSSGVRLRELAQDSSRRAARWGAVGGVPQ
jgi:hypothetical protein